MLEKASVQLCARLRQQLADREQRARIAGTFSWQAFCSRPVPGARVLLSQADFAKGTVRIRHPGVYQLTEDISFNPNQKHDWTPTAEQVSGGPDAAYPALPHGPYHLGFFAAIAIEAQDVTLDLRGYRIEQHPAHALAQRFYANIELADQPFVPNQGPSSFGPTLESAERVAILNGTLGRSSHHGIHGNGMSGVLLEDLVFHDFEVAGIALNGGEDIVIKACHMLGSRQDVPVLGTWSTARFIRPFAEAILAAKPDAGVVLRGQRYSGRALLDRLLAALRDGFADIIDRGVPAGTTNPDAMFFHNSAGNTDGNVYGLLLNPLGVAVGGFLPARAEGMRNDRIVVDDVRIDNIRATIREIVALSVRAPDHNSGYGGTGRVQTGPIGEVLPIREIADPATGAYVGTALSDVEIFIAAAGDGPAQRGRTSIDPAIVSWASGAANIEDVAKAEGFHFVLNGDSMHHVNKGVLGVRVDGAHNVLLRHCHVRSIVNDGAPGLEVPAGVYAKLHGGQTLPGYGGAAARGISLAGCSGAVVQTSSVQGVRSRHGSAFGVDVMTESANVLLQELAVADIQPARASAAGASPNPPPRGVPIQVAETAREVRVEGNCGAVIRKRSSSAVRPASVCMAASAQDPRLHRDVAQ